MLILLFTLATPAAETWREPPDPIPAILDARRPPSVEVSDDGAWLAMFERPDLPPLADLAAPEVALAGLRVDPTTYGPAEPAKYRGLALRRREAVGPGLRVPLPPDRAITGWSWSRDDTRLALTLLGPDGYELWVVPVNDAPSPQRLLGGLHAVTGAPCDWLPGDAGLVCKVRVHGAPPVAPAVPPGPRVEESLGVKKPARTAPDLLRTPFDHDRFSHYTRSRLVHVALDGAVRPLAEGEIAQTSVSPDGAWLLVQHLVGPWSSEVTWGSFARRVEALELATGRVAVLAELPVADQVPIAFDAVRPGRRSVAWRGDKPASVAIVEALDGGDPKREAAHRDQISTWDAPFAGAPAPLWRTELRFSGLTWGDDGLALLSEARHTDRRTRTWRVTPGDPATPPALLFDRSSQDAYGDPGAPLVHRGPHGGFVLRRAKNGDLWFVGAGATPAGDRPFLDRRPASGAAPTRVWQADLDRYESVVRLLDDEAKAFLTWRQSQTEVPNLVLHQGARARPITAFTDWAPQLAGVRKEILTYVRADGLPLSATVYLPPGYDPKRDGPRPAVFWVYPSEFKRRSDAAQVTATASTFTRPSGASHLFFLLRGWIVVDDPTLPIVGEGDVEPNDSYVQQLQDGAKAHVDALVAKGLVDRDRIVVGGHSYGAFTTANLLAHTDLFRAGIARSGAYNRTLTPFGFQGEERTFWEAPDTYVAMSPFSVADRIDEPLLLIHGADDKNVGTWPVQSQRLYDALKGHGATVRFVELPFENHGYRARESVGTTLAEMIGWAERWAPPPS